MKYFVMKPKLELMLESFLVRFSHIFHVVVPVLLLGLKMAELSKKSLIYCIVKRTAVSCYTLVQYRPFNLSLSIHENSSWKQIRIRKKKRYFYVNCRHEPI